MGVDYRKLVIAVNGTCGVECMFPTLEGILTNQKGRIMQIQQDIGRVAHLFSYGMGPNAFQYVDTMAAALVQIRHYIAKEGTLEL